MLTLTCSAADRAVVLAQQFQTLGQALATCDPQSPTYPRLLNLLLRLNKALRDIETAAAKAAAKEKSPRPAPKPASPRPEPQILTTEHPDHPSIAPKSESSLPIQNLKSKIQNSDRPPAAKLAS